MPAIAAWFGGLNFKLIAGVAVVAAVLLAVFMVYREGKRSAEADELRHIAANNAHIAQQFAQQVSEANDIAAKERARAENAEDEARKLKEKINAIAKGDASPGVDAAVHGLHPGPTAAVKPAPVPRPR